MIEAVKNRAARLETLLLISCRSARYFIAAHRIRHLSIEPIAKTVIVMIPIIVLLAAAGKTDANMTLQVASVMPVLAGLSFVNKKYELDRPIRANENEVQDNIREADTEQQVKALERQIQREMSRKHMMQDVPTADVVLADLTQTVVALKYTPDEMDAPKVVAKGERIIAEKIRETALIAGVPIVENRPLACALFSMCDIGSYVPTKLYRAAAEVLASVYRQRGVRS